jgi:uncharacterized protein YbjT (DUF2867 family)
MKHALLIGATGLVGSHLLQLLLDDDRFKSVTVFVRRSTGITHPKMAEHLIDFDKPTEWHHLVKGDVIYLALGTTLARAGSKEAQYKVDHTFQYQFARAASEHGVPELVLVSSAGAGKKSGFFYMRMKAELERDIEKLSFKKKVFIRPGALTGPRQEKRMGEKIGIGVLRLVNGLGLFRKYRPIHAAVVANAMINATMAQTNGVKIYELERVFELAELNK